MIGSLRYFVRTGATLSALILLTALLCPAARAADDKDKEKKPEKEKKEKIEPWVEVRTAHFIVASDGGEKTARHFADMFESLDRVFHATMPNSRIGNGIPIRILASRDAKSFARMAPEFPYDKNHEQPPGIFLFGRDKNYILVRANASGHFPYMDIFQNYARDVLKHSYRSLPPWLEEGYSTVYGNITFNDRGIRLERPDPEDLSVLFESPLLPLDLVLRVNRASPYYSPGNKQSVYFAESRVLLHLLISDSQFAGTKAMEQYVTAVQSGTDQLQAARDAFGDLNQLQTKLDAFVKNVSGPPAEIPVSGGNESASSPRTLTAPEIDARMADFLAQRGRSEDAEDKLNDAIMNQPTLAEAEQSLGFLLLKRDDLDEAQKHFDRAVQLDPNDALNYYGQGLVALAQAGKGSVPAGAAAPFEKSVSLNADFAPAWNYLAMIYSQRDETLQKALADARRAAALAPGEGSYQSQLAAIQDRISHPEEARTAAARAQGTAGDRPRADRTGGLAVRSAPPPPPGAPSSASPVPAKTTSDSGLRIERKTEPDAKPAPTTTIAAAPKPEPPRAPVPPLFSSSQSSTMYSMVGTIAEVNCASAPQVQVTLKSQTITMKLHADNLDKISFKAAGSAAPAKGTTCPGLRGRTARISYFLVPERPWDGEIQVVEFRGQQ